MKLGVQTTRSTCPPPLHLYVLLYKVYLFWMKRGRTTKDLKRVTRADGLPVRPRGSTIGSWYGIHLDCGSSCPASRAYCIFCQVKSVVKAFKVFESQSVFYYTYYIRVPRVPP